MVVDEVIVRRGREGSRWYNQRPPADDVSYWFSTAVRLHDGLEHEHYIGGVTLIQATEKSDEVASFDKDGLPIIRERRDLVYIPYVKVETRVAYFWTLLERHPEWRGEILPVPNASSDELGLPPGFFRYVAADPKNAGKTVSFVGVSMQVMIYERSRTTGQDRPLITPAPGTKLVAAASKWDVDPHALSKAETGAVGRALGMAGMLVIPGSGVATAEDMQELGQPGYVSDRPHGHSGIPGLPPEIEFGMRGTPRPASTPRPKVRARPTARRSTRRSPSLRRRTPTSRPFNGRSTATPSGSSPRTSSG
jgi:hypothetical protein